MNPTPERQREIRAARLLRGHCTDCNHPALPDRSFCATHLAARRESNRRRKAKR